MVGVNGRPIILFQKRPVEYEVKKKTRTFAPSFAISIAPMSSSSKLPLIKLYPYVYYCHEIGVLRLQLLSKSLSSSYTILPPPYYVLPYYVGLLLWEISVWIVEHAIANGIHLKELSACYKWPLKVLKCVFVQSCLSWDILTNVTQLVIILWWCGQLGLRPILICINLSLEI